eukprot:m.360081 g.360081  ORF g.360081 m.360081 type:complete len:239 (+) comp18866_c0_seq1:406-1122(+)
MTVQRVVIINIVYCFLLVLAISIPDWSRGTATRDAAEGRFKVGLWKACANVEGVMVFSNNLDGADCRYGHCIEPLTFTREAAVDAHGLCGKAKWSAASALLALGFSLLVIYHTAVMKALNWDVCHDWAILFQLLSAIFSFLSWIVWAAWQGAFNRDQDRESPIALVTFSKLVASTCFVLMLIASIVAVIALKFEFSLFVESIQAEPKGTEQEMSDLRAQAPSNPVPVPDFHTEDDVMA